MAGKVQVTELDFDDIKTNLKTYMKGQSEFSDYNFEGSGLSAILDVLAYNTHYLAMNANFAANEMFLDSSSLRNSVVSHAKTLGYTPRSARAPLANLDITVSNGSLSSLTINKGQKFTTSIGGTSYGFVVNEDVTATQTNGLIIFGNLPVYEGTLVTTKYTVDSNDPEKKYLITSNRADTTTLKVKVQNSSSDTTTNTYTKSQTLTELDSTSKVYFLQECDDGKNEVYFGDGVLGKSLTDGNIITLEYIVTNKEVSNGSSSFVLGGTVGGFTDVSISTVSVAQGGSVAQSNN